MRARSHGRLAEGLGLTAQTPEGRTPQTWLLTTHLSSADIPQAEAVSLEHIIHEGNIGGGLGTVGVHGDVDGWSWSEGRHSKDWGTSGVD